MLPESHPLADAQVMLLLLFEKAPPDQYIEFRAIWDQKHRKRPPPDGKKAHIEMVQVKDLEKIFDMVLADWIMRHNRAEYDIYFGVCPRRRVSRTRDGYALAGKNEDVSHAVCAWMDYDKMTYRAVMQEEPRPFLVVFTGHGAHFYWRYADAVDVQVAIEDNRKIKEKYGGDSTTEAARILRLPGTRNWKEPERELVARLETINEDAVFSGWKEAPKDHAGDGKKKSVFDLPWDLRNVIVSGYSAAEAAFEARDPETKQIDRSAVDYRVMSSLLDHGYAEDDIRSIFFNKEFGISAKTLEEAQRGNAENYFQRTFEKARLEYQKRSLITDQIGDTIEFETWQDLRKAPALEFAVDCILPVGGLLIISGPAKTGKSFLVNDLSILLAGGAGKFLEMFEVRKPGSVVYCQAEITRGSLDFRMSMLAQSRDVDWRKVPIYFFNQKFDLGNPKHMWAIINGLKKVKADYFIIDPLARFHHEDENKQRDMAGILSNIDRIKSEAGVLGTIVVHHHGKPVEGAEREGVHMIRGASVIGDWGNSHLILTKKFNKYTSKKYCKVQFELRDAEEPASFHIAQDKKNFRFYPYDEDDSALPIVREIKMKGGSDDDQIVEVAERLGISKIQARNLILKERSSSMYAKGNGDVASQPAPDITDED